ncbi:MAG: radical SAM protein [Candidatus Hodarchaeota archaeon]
MQNISQQLFFRKTLFRVPQMNPKLKLVKNTFLNKIGFKRPLTLAHLMTLRCNSKCSFCVYWRKGDIKREMTTDQIFKMLDESTKLGIFSYAAIGGEPLLRKDIGEILRYAYKNASLMTLLVTNGFLLEKKIGEVLNYCSGITISLDTLDPEMYQKIRGVDGFDSVMSAIDCVIEKKKSGSNLDLNINTVIHENNLNELEALVKFAHKKGIGITLEPISIQKEIVETSPTIGTQASFREAIIRLLEMKRGKYRKTIWLTEYYLNNLLTRTPFRCLPHLLIRVNDKGDVTLPCYEVPNQTVVGNVLETPLPDIYFQKSNSRYWKIGENCSHPDCFLLCYYEPSLSVQSIKYAFNFYRAFGAK